MLDGVLAVGNAEAEFKVEALEQFSSEEMPFDHSELGDWFVAHRELNSARKRQQPRQ